MWLTGQAWCKQGIKTPTDVNLIYKYMKCLAHCFNSLKVLKQFQTMLLYTSKPKLMKPYYHVTYTQKHAVMLKPKEKHVVMLLQQP